MLAQSRPHLALTLDDHEVLAVAKADPRGFLNQFPGGLTVVDEVQRAPELILAAKALVDRDPRPGQLCFTGSSDILRLPAAADSLAGRAATVPLAGLSQGELAGVNEDFAAWIRAMPAAPQTYTSAWTRQDYIDALGRGGYPELRAREWPAAKRWLGAYFDRLATRDLADVSRSLSAPRLASIARLVAANQAGETVKARLASDLELPASTVTRYLHALDAMYLTRSLPPWRANLTEREIGRHKLSIADSALAMHLDRTSPARLAPLTTSPLGGLVEGFAAGELAKQQTWSAEPHELYHFRDSDLGEVDAVMEFDDGAVFLLEFKTAMSYQARDLRAIRALAARLGDRFLGGMVLGFSASSYRLGERLWAMPLSILWEHATPAHLAPPASPRPPRPPAPDPTDRGGLTAWAAGPA
jgi:predicted AAA+ superfamily ATPase